MLAAAFAAAGSAVAWRPVWVVRFPGAILLAIGVLSLLALAPLVAWDPLGLDLQIDPSTEPLLPRGDPAQEVYHQAVRDFGDDEVFVIAMQSEDVFRAETLARLRRVTDRIARFPEVRKVQSLTDVVAFRYDAEGDWIEVASFLDEIPTDPSELEAARQRALADPLYQKILISEDGRTAAINVTFRKMTDQQFIDARMDARIRAVLDAETTSEVRFYMAGRSHIKDRVYRLMVRDMRRLIPIALGVVALGLWLVFGSWRAVVLPMAVILVSALWTFGAMAYLERPLTVLTTLLAPMLAAIGSAYGIHMVSRYQEEATRGRDTASAALHCLRQMRLPVLLAGLTTMIGFGALLITDVPAVLEVGAFSVLGVASITLLSLTMLPAALAISPLRSEGEAAARGLSSRIDAGLDRALTALCRMATRRATPVLVVSIALVAVCAAAIPRIVIDTDYLSFFDESSEIRREFEAVNRLLAGAVPIYISLRADQPGSFRDAAVLRSMERIQQRAEEIPAVSRTLSLVDTVRVMNRVVSRDDPEAERIPDTRGAVAELIFMAPKGDLDRYTNVNHSRANVLVRTGAVGSAAVQSVAAQLETAISEGALPEGIQADVTGNAILLSRSADGIARSQPQTVCLAALAIFVLVAVSFRSLRLGSVAMVPNLVPVVIFFGALGLGAAPLSLPTSLIGSIALGIAIDDTVHFLVRYGRERRLGVAPEEAALLCARRAGRAIAITSFMLMAGFLVVGLSSFATLREFGVLSAATMGVCLLTDLVLLPALLVRTRS
jgi:predicted RND superfamily exporter protein